MKSKSTILILESACVLSAWAGWWMIHVFLGGDNRNWLLFFVFFFGHLILILVLAAIAPSRALIVFSLSFAAGFLVAQTFWYLFLLLLATGVFALGGWRMKSFIRNMTVIKLRQGVYWSYSFVTTAIVLAIVFAYFFNIRSAKGLEEPLNIQPQISAETTDFFLDTARYLWGGAIYKNDINQTVDEMITSSIKGERIEEDNSDQSVTEEEIATQRMALEKQWGVDLNGDEPMSQVINALLNKQLERRLGGITKETETMNGSARRNPWLLAAGLFLGLKAISWALRLPVAIMAGFIFTLLRRLGWISVVKRQVLAERIRE